MRMLFIAFTLLAVGCSENDEPPELGCASSSDCDAGMRCINGACVERAADVGPGTLTVGEPCEGDVECTSGNCECVDFECAERVCADADCVCGYGTSGACDNPMEGRHDPEDCVDPAICGASTGACD